MRKSIAIARRAGFLTLPLIALAPAGQAQAGGFGLREQSSYYQGTAFAGNAAGGEGLASMYWNPAAISFTPGFSTEGNATYIMPHAPIDVYGATAPLTGTSLGTVGVGDVVDDKLLPTTYFSYAWDRIAIGVAVTVPFGLVTDTDCNWSGRYYGCHSSIFDLNVQGSIAYKVTDWLTLGGGLNVNYLHAKLSNAQFAGLPPLNNLYAVVTGDDVAMGFNLGALFTLAPGTTIGIGYRSALQQTLEGTLDLSLMNTRLVSTQAQAGIKLPDQATASLRSKLNDKWTVLGTVEWTNWSTFQDLVVTAANGAVSIQEMQWNDGWFFSGGVEYQWDPKLALRGGIAYELSPVPDDTRSPRMPDTNRFWLSGGFTYAVTDKLSMDFAYSHLFAQSGSIVQLPSMTGNALRGSLVGEVSGAYVDLVSVGLRYKFGELKPGPVTMD